MTSADRRPWAFISRREATALLGAAENAPLADVSQDLARAISVLRRQLEWIETGAGERPSIAAALFREVRP